MNLPNTVTAVRIALAPVFFFFFLLPRWTAFSPLASVIFLWLLFGAIELTDLLDGSLARRLGQTSDTGKLLDPFADSLSRLTYFLCFAAAGLMPLWIFLILLYRDLGVSFIRLMMARKGVYMGARLSGKVKAWVYAVAGIAGLFVLTVRAVPSFGHIAPASDAASFGVFALCAAVAVWSFLDYLRALWRRES